MPLIQVSLREGRSPEDLRRLGARLTEATAETLGVPPESVRVLIAEVPGDLWFVGGRPIGAPRPDRDRTPAR